MTDEDRAVLDAAIVRHLVPDPGARLAVERRALSATWISRLPEAVVHVRSAAGPGAFAGGRLRSIDPDMLAPVIAFATHGDPDLEGDTWPVALGRFGEVVVWSARHGAGLWTPWLPALEMPWLRRTAPSAARQVMRMIVTQPPEAIDPADADGMSIAAALETWLPAPGPGEIRGAVPVPVPLEGVPPGDFEVAPAAEWLAALHAEAATMLVDWDRPDTPELRQVGDRRAAAGMRP